MAPVQWAELFLWMVALAGIIGVFCACMYRFIKNDTTEYDMEFLWDRKYRLKDLELTPKQRK
ncbi:hypothetical protein SK3146_02094 [Paenibacillus konkukensis]|uniref:Uncharacterized protein n=1 Tax=Paenibacillus konkukensis TaxID=2020716 RepID=A0ABY4RNA7_9BACL|nr:hypothetical protein [Paenibacillus konkukensis]UQZ82934.1 hypothetical protein SK3146_02094 [Paenibacillus konkukensis]